MEQSFLPTMRTLFYAPVTSPLSEVDTNNVAELFIELTRPSTETQVHTHNSTAYAKKYFGIMQLTITLLVAIFSLISVCVLFF